MFNPNMAFIIENEANYRKKKIKETVYSTINNSVNKHDNTDSAWNNVLCKESIKTKQFIQFKETIHREKRQSKGQDGNSGT